MRRMVLVLLLASFPSVAQEFSDRIDEKALRDIRQSFVLDKETSDIQQKVISNNINELAFNPKSFSVLSPDRRFSHVIHRKNPTDQRRSGRCWLFAGLNIVRYDIGQTLGVSEFELSQNYNFFYHKLEMANFMFEREIEAYGTLNDKELNSMFTVGLSDGGNWNMAVSLVEKYGVVPKSIMPETFQSSNTMKMNDLLDALVKRHIVKIEDMIAAKYSRDDIRQYKRWALKEVYRFLAFNLGQPPIAFSFTFYENGETKSAIFTPQDFYRRFSHKPLTNKVILENDPNRPYYKLYRTKWAKDMQEDSADFWLNVPMDEMREAVKRSILDDDPVWFGADVGKQMNMTYGTLKDQNFLYSQLFHMDFEPSRAERMRTFNSIATHAMTIVGIDVQDNSAKKYLVENSWGLAGYDGYFVMYDDWFRQYVMHVVIDRKYLADDELLALLGDITDVPPWDWTFKLDSAE